MNSQKEKLVKMKPNFWQFRLRHSLLPFPLAVSLLLFLALGVILARRMVNLRSRAGGDLQPQQVRITNVTDRSFVVSWLTLPATKGSLLVNINSTDALFQDSRGDGNFTTHYIVVDRGLQAGQTYNFTVISGGKQFRSASYQVHLAQPIAGMLPKANLAYGKVCLPDGSPASGGIVYLNIPGLAPLSSLVSSEGHWVIPLSVAFNTSLRKLNPSLSPETEEVIQVIRRVGKPTSVRNLVSRNQPVPLITLGKDADFRQQHPSASPSPVVTQTIGLLPDTGITPTPAPFSILSPDEGEKINTNRPQIFGRGAPGGVVKIEIHSSQPSVSAEIPIGTDQQWSWTVPDGLDPGDHTLTVYYYDPLGKEQTFTRHFTVLAADNIAEPAFTASATATLAPSPTPLPSPTPSPSPKPSSRPTVAAPTVTTIPNSGTESFSVLLIVLSFLTLGFGGYLWWFSDEI